MENIWTDRTHIFQGTKVYFLKRWYSWLFHFPLITSRYLDNYHVVHVFPVVEGDELESCQHRPEQVVEACEPIVGIFSNTMKAHKTMRTRPEYRASSEFWQNSFPRKSCKNKPGAGQKKYERYNLYVLFLEKPFECHSEILMSKFTFETSDKRYSLLSLLHLMF